MLDELIERIQARVVEDGDCWIWQGACQPNSPTPVMRWQGRTQGVRRLVAEAKGIATANRRITCKCRTELCVHPDHVVALTHSRMQQLIASEHRYQASPLRMKKLADKARARAKLTFELALQIREAQGNQYDIAEQFGVSQPTVSSIKRGRTWRDYSNPFAQLIKRQL